MDIFIGNFCYLLFLTFENYFSRSAKAPDSKHNIRKELLNLEDSSSEDDDEQR